MNVSKDKVVQFHYNLSDAEMEKLADFFKGLSML